MHALAMYQVSVSLCGAGLLIFDQGHDVIGVRDARVLTSLTCLLIMTCNNEFATIFLTFKHAASSGIPVVTMVLFFTSIFALANQDLFGDLLIDEYTGNPYFDTFSNSIATCFRLIFGWNDVM